MGLNGGDKFENKSIKYFGKDSDSTNSNYYNPYAYTAHKHRGKQPP